MKDSSGDSPRTTFPDIGPPWCHPLLFFNLSVWRDFDCLARFIRLPEHRAVMDDRGRWTEPVHDCPSLAMWWIEEDTVPNVESSIAAFESIAAVGDSKFAFSPRSPLRDYEAWLATE